MKKFFAISLIAILVLVIGFAIACKAEAAEKMIPGPVCVGEFNFNPDTGAIAIVGAESFYGSIHPKKTKIKVHGGQKLNYDNLSLLNGKRVGVAFAYVQSSSSSLDIMDYAIAEIHISVRGVVPPSNF